MNTAMKLIALVATVAVVAAYEEEDNVLVLGSESYQDAIKEFDPLLVEFYAPWCGHCQKLAPEYASAAKTLKAKGIRIAKVDATQNEDLAKEIGVKSYPTLKWVQGGTASDYEGPRTARGIVSWISKRVGPAAEELDSADKVQAFTKENDVAVVGFYADKTSRAAKAFLATAAKVDSAAFALVSDEAVAEAAGADMESMVLFKENGVEQMAFDGKARKAAMTKWIKDNQLPLVIPFTESNADMIFGSSIKVHYLLFADDREHASAIAGFKKIAPAHKGKLLFVVVNAEQRNVLEYFKVGPEDFPTAFIVDMPEGGQMKRYALEGDEVSEKTLGDFASNFASGSLKRSLKSEDAQEDDLDQDVAVLRGSTIAQVVNDPTKDVLVEFYAPWCGHCKQLAPIYEKVGAAFEDEDSVIVAKMDATANDIPESLEGVDVAGFPTLFFFPAGGKPQAYDGPRTEEGMTSFLKKNAKSLQDNGDL